MSEFENPEPKEKTFVDKIIDKGKQLIEETTDTGDVVELLVSINNNIIKLNSEQTFDNLYKIEETEFNFTDLIVTQNKQIITPLDGYYIHIHLMTFSCPQGIIEISFDELGTFIINGNYELKNIFLYKNNYSGIKLDSQISSFHSLNRFSGDASFIIKTLFQYRKVI